MRHSIGFKFVAVILCAAALAGMLISAGGIVLLMGTGLYSMTPEAYREERILEIGQGLAQELASWYCTENLGSVREDVAEYKLTNFYYGGFDRRYAYMELVDRDGTVLSTKWSERVKESAQAQNYTIPVTGEYMHMLRMEPIPDPQETVDPETLSPFRTEDYAYYTTIEDAPVEIYRVVLDMGDAGRRFSGQEPVGVVFATEDGKFRYEHFDTVTMAGLEGGWVYTADLQDKDGNSVFFAHSPSSVGKVVATNKGRFRIELDSYEAVAQPPESQDMMDLAGDSGASNQLVVASETSAVSQSDAAEVPAAVSNEQEPTIGGKPLSQYRVMSFRYYDGEQNYNVEYIWVPIEGMSAQLYVEPGAVVYDGFLRLSSMIYPYREQLFIVLGVCGVLFAAFAVYLACAAGHKPKRQELRAGGLNLIPLDLYLGALAAGIYCLVFLVIEGGDFLLRQSVRAGGMYVIAACYVASLGAVGFSFAFAAQVKMPAGFCWRNTLCFRLVYLGWKILAWGWSMIGKFFTTGLPLLSKKLAVLIRWLLAGAGAASRFLLGRVKALARWIGRVVKRLDSWLRRQVTGAMNLLPLTWQWILGGCLVLGLPVAGMVLDSEFLALLGLLGSCTIVLGGAHYFGILMASARRMSKGDLTTKVDKEKMVGCFRSFAEDLNGLADVAEVAAKKQLKSERMKAELITNVSHDIKTPLTSIINYVDLLQRAETPEQREEYLEVLDRQSQRMKKLITDLIEMSKASTGNLPVDLQILDAGECVHQALGEFGDKLEGAKLTPVVRTMEGDPRILADGRLMWRVLSNVLSNAVKYAMPGTRLYIDLLRVEDRIVVSLKNISRAELNVDGEELMERFVRGDDSRNTEGSGLGLNIAKSLMELQKGRLDVVVDGDLFKVTLAFRPASGAAVPPDNGVLLSGQ